MRPLKLQASRRAQDIVRKHKLVDGVHRFGNVSVLATIPGKFYSRKLEWTSSADQLKFNSRLIQINMKLIGPAIVAFVHSELGNFRESRKLQTVQTHKTSH